MVKGVTKFYLSPGTILGGSYQIIRLIGEGGMGAVYLAYDSHLDLKVAVKVISSGLVESMETEEYNVALRRFQAEAKIAAQIDHPNVIRIFGLKHDTIVHEGQPCNIDYLVMELMAERTLRDTMDISGFESEEEVKEWISRFIIPILDGLEDVHNRGIIHRDIKPENIFMRENTPKLADFGLSMGKDFPSLTDSLAEILGTLTYMAPEQYNNFSLAREAADIFSMGRILHEAVEGKITEKTTPFKQLCLSATNSRYYKNLNEIIMMATDENIRYRISSARELRTRLQGIQNQNTKITSKLTPNKKVKWYPQALIISGLVFFVSIIVFLLYLHFMPPKEIIRPPELAKVVQKAEISSDRPIVHQAPKRLDSVLRGEDDSVLHLIVAMEMQLPPDDPLYEEGSSFEAFYLSESPVTNEQYVEFLNENLTRVSYNGSAALIDGNLAIKLSEKIRGYKPIIFKDNQFQVQSPMHASCAVLMVTGYGADLYAKHYGFRLVKAHEWYALAQLAQNDALPRLALPTPVVNYPQGKFGVRGINQIAEWGRGRLGKYIILGQTSSSMVDNALMLEKEPSKYYTDTSFRVAKDISLELLPR